MKADQLQNELLLIKHHAQDGLKGLKGKNGSIIKSSLMDILESVNRMAKMLPGKLATAIDDIAESIE